MASGTAAAAPTIDLGDNTVLESSLTVNYTASMRTAKRANEYLVDSNVNGDDGTRNFDRGSLVTNRVSLFGEVMLHHENMGAVLRGSYFYDDVYHQNNDNDWPGTVNKSGSYNSFLSDTRRDSGGKARLLDAYVYGNFDVFGDQYLALKAGRHLVAWGESLFWANISQGQTAVDATKFNVPGTEAKDAYLPVGQVSANWQINDDLTLMGYYQYKWEESQLSPVGDYFSTSDIFGTSAEVMLYSPYSTAGMRYAGEEEPRDSGQWGVGARYRLTESTEVGLYHTRYHERIGALLFSWGPETVYSSFDTVVEDGTYKLAYFDDVELTGVSFSSKLGDSVQFAGDISYRDGAAVYLDNGAPARGQLWQTNLNAMYIIGPSWLSHQTTVFGEVMNQYIEGVDSVNVTVGGYDAGTYDTFQHKGQTRDSTLLGLGAQMDYPGVFSGWDLVTKISWQQNIDGTALQGLGRDEKRLTLSGDLKYLGNFQVGLTYVDFLSSPSLEHSRLMSDRDYVSFNAKYTF
ncbi:hypothetical protein AO726_16505 [Pseudomonas sp. TTU2014-080ASC]|nr:hypothetical protein AO726_16505 [Pseudomonas sp. TTU2014-080ASC]